jgi:hypothetical protein
MADAARPLMELLALTMEDDILRLQLHPAPYQWRAGLRSKRDEDLLWRERDISNARPLFPHRQQAELRQLDMRQARLEGATGGKNEIDTRPVEAGPEIIGITEVERSILRHARALF